jgi:hypothetical protein
MTASTMIEPLVKLGPALLHPATLIPAAKASLPALAPAAVAVLAAPKIILTAHQRRTGARDVAADRTVEWLRGEVAKAQQAVADATVKAKADYERRVAAAQQGEQLSIILPASVSSIELSGRVRRSGVYTFPAAEVAPFEPPNIQAVFPTLREARAKYLEFLNEARPGTAEMSIDQFVDLLYQNEL